MRGTLVAMLVLLVLSSCSSGETLIEAESEARIEVQTRSGTLDCPDELISSSIGEFLEDAVGADSAQEALDKLPSWAPPRGEPGVENQEPEETVFLFLDDDGNRLGRVGTASPTDRGWFVLWIDKCGTG
jgi:hypothetical protein